MAVVTCVGLVFGGTYMEAALTWIGGVVVIGFLVRTIAEAVKTSGLEELTIFRFRFKGNEKPPKQLKE